MPKTPTNRDGRHSRNRNIEFKHLIYTSGRLWHKVTDAIKKKDLDAATDAKIEIEDAQREERSRGNQDEWRPRFFQLKGEDWHPLFRQASATSWPIASVRD